LRITGPFNVQMLSRHNEVKVIECNLRASRSLPFVSKALGQNFVREAVRLMLGYRPSAPSRDPLDLDYAVVKAPQFSFRRLPGVDPALGIEMASIGEVACFGGDAEEALLKALLATGFRIPQKAVLLSLGPVGDKYRFVDETRALIRQGLRVYATAGTADMLHEEGIDCTALDKEELGPLPSAVDHMRSGLIDLVINVPRDYDEKGRPDGATIRRVAVDLEIPLLTDLWLSRRVVRAMIKYSAGDLRVKPWGAYVSNAATPSDHFEIRTLPK
jgi:carbamoyl-phosphate synthase large subunit